MVGLMTKPNLAPIPGYRQLWLGGLPRLLMYLTSPHFGMGQDMDLLERLCTLLSASDQRMLSGGLSQSKPPGQQDKNKNKTNINNYNKKKTY